MTVPLCLLCLDFLLCEQQKTQKTTKPLPFVHLFYGESFEMMQYMVRRLVLWGCKDFCHLLWVSPHRRVLSYWLTRKVLKTNSIYLFHLY